MAINATVNTGGLINALRRLPLNLQRNVMSGAVRAGATTISDSAKTCVPVDTGTLQKSIGVTKRKSSQGVYKFSVSPRKGGKNSGWYGHFVEFGTSKMSARPFMRPAYENNGTKAIDTAKDYIAQRLDDEVLKARR